MKIYRYLAANRSLRKNICLHVNFTITIRKRWPNSICKVRPPKGIRNDQLANYNVYWMAYAKCYFHSFSNTNIGNPYNVFRLDIFLFLSFNNAQQHGIYLFLKIFLCTKGEVWPRNHLISISADGKYMFDYEIDRVWRFLRVPEPFENCPKN